MVLACVVGRAEAADTRHRLSIPAKGYADALIDLGVQANVSIVGTSACGPGGAMGLSGRYALAEALDLLLRGAPCRHRIVDPRTVRISAIPPDRPMLPPAREPVGAPMLVTELVVTATKRPASVEHLAASVSAISRDQLALTGAVDVSQTAGQVAGVLTTNLGPGRDKLLIRGLSDGAFTGRTRSTVSTYLDDAPINYNAPDPDLRLVDLDRIEVVRGPQGALYGSGALAGVYRIVTRKPDLEQVEAGIAGSAADTVGGAPSKEIEGYLSLPLIPGRAALRVVAYHDRKGGYLDDVNLGVANVDETMRKGARAALRVRLDETWRLDLTAVTQHLRSNDTQYVTGGQRANRVRETHDNDIDHRAATLTGDLGWASLVASTAHVSHSFSSQYDATMVVRTFGAAPGDVGLYVESARVGMWAQDVVLRSANGSRFSWLVGAFASTSQERTPSTLAIDPQDGPQRLVYIEARRDRLRELAVYGEGSLEITPEWTASVGARLFESRVGTSADVTVAPPGESRAFDSARAFQGLSPTLSVQREDADGDMIYVLFSEGYRPGGFNSGGILAIRPSRTTFAPDRLRNYEVGAKLRLLDRRLAVRTAAYWADWSRLQTDQYRPSGLAYTGNVGDARVVGLEGEVGYEWDFGLSMQLSGLLSKSRIRNPNPDFAPQVTPTLPGVPQVSGGVLAIYQRPLAGDMTLRLTGEASYIGRSTLSFDAALAPRMGHYLRVRLSAQAAADRWSATLFVSNPLNSDEDTFAYGNPFSFSEVRQVTPQRPRTVGLKLAYDL